MKHELRVSDYLHHILVAIERIEQYTSDIDEVGFLTSELIQDAVIRNIEIIGEASKNVLRTSPDFADRHDEIPWFLMYEMRNRVSHGYHKVDMEIVWKTVQHDLPDLHGLVRAALSDRQGSDPSG